MNLPYVQDMEAITQLKLGSNSNFIPSAVHDTELAKYCVRNLVPFSPLWSSYVHDRETNSVIENHHKVIKRDVMMGKSNIKPGRLVNTTKLIRSHRDDFCVLCLFRLYRDEFCLNFRSDFYLRNFSSLQRRN